MKTIVLAMAGLAAPALVGLALLPGDSPAAAPAARAVAYHSPISVCVSADGRRAYVVNQTADSVSVLDLDARTVLAEIPVGYHPSHAALSLEGGSLYVACRHGGWLDVVDLAAGRVARSIPTGYEPYGVTLSRSGTRLYVANSQSDSVSVIDAASGRTLAEIPVGRDPRYVAETPDGARLVVANGLGRSVSIVDPAAGQVKETRSLGRASILRQVVCTRDGRWAFVAHILSRDELIPLQIERGWIHSNGFSVLDLAQPGHRVTLLLDRLLAGAASPWGLALCADGRRLYVSLAGVHEIAIVDVEKALALVAETRPEGVERLEQDVEILERRGIARRVAAGGLGPRGVALRESAGELLVANYFSDAVSVLDAATGEVRAVIPLGPPQEMTPWRKGELLLNDARITYQGWFACYGCHQEDATVDGLSWDLPNDGLGNPKNVKSLYDINDTPPAMWSRVREDMEEAVAAGQRFQGFLPDPENQRAIMAYLGSPPRLPKPFRGRSPEAERRGEQVFRRALCHTCHPPPVFTDLKAHDVGLGSDGYRSRFDTPSLRHVYRTAPYLHDGRAKTLREIFTEHNPHDHHGRTSRLSEEELDDLVEYLRGQ